MKAKRIVIFLAETLFALAAFLAKADKPVPSIDQLSEISLHSLRTGWGGRFFPNGSAQISYGSNGGDMARAPARSFSLDEVYNLVIPHLKQGRDNREDMALFLHVKGQASTPALYIEDKEIMRTLMHGLRDKAVPFVDKARFEELLGTYPLVPGDKPAPFTYGYDEETYHALRRAAYDPSAILANVTAIADAAEQPGSGEPASMREVQPEEGRTVVFPLGRETPTPVVKDEAPPSGAAAPDEPPRIELVASGKGMLWRFLVGLATAIGAMAAWLRLRKK